MKFSSFKHSGSETKILPLAIQGPASALRCEVLGCSSRDGLPSLFPDLGLATGPHPLATTVIKPWQLCTHTTTQAKPEQLKLSKTDPSTWS
jgi:hypothetical protein